MNTANETRNLELTNAEIEIIVVALNSQASSIENIVYQAISIDNSLVMADLTSKIGVLRGLSDSIGFVTLNV